MIENKKVIACYIRLSEDDEETTKGIKDESNSVTSQRNLLRSYIGRDSDFEGYGISEYVDDGFTGTTFTRPGFERMIEDAKRGDIGIIIVKDFSRLGRDHLETGNLLERIFPLLGIRFISVNDCYDSADCNGMTGGLTVALKNVMNAMYSRDLSGKVMSAMETRVKNGQYVAARVPFGYRKDPDDIHHLIIDEEAADIVRQIFGFAADGKGKNWIKGYLNSNGIPTPSEYMVAHGLSAKNNRNREHPMWTVTTIGDIIRNQTYIGNTCWNKSRQNISTGRKNVKNKRDDWTVIEGTHEPIVSRDVFDRANERAFTGKHNQITGKACPLVYCAYCGRSMSAPKDKNHIRYRCVNGYGEFAREDCKRTRIKAADLEQAVLANVNMMAEIYAGKRSRLKSSGNAGAELEKKLTLLQKERERLSARKVRLYEEYRSGGSREVYISKKQQTDDRLAEIEAELNELEQRLEAAKRSEKDISQTEMVLLEVSAIDRFDKETLKKIIDRINVYSENEIEIIWKPMDVIFQRITPGKDIIDIYRDTAEA